MAKNFTCKDSKSLNLECYLKDPALKGCSIAYSAVGRWWDLWEVEPRGLVEKVRSLGLCPERDLETPTLCLSFFFLAAMRWATLLLHALPPWYTTSLWAQINGANQPWEHMTPFLTVNGSFQVFHYNDSKPNCKQAKCVFAWVSLLIKPPNPSRGGSFPMTSPNPNYLPQMSSPNACMPAIVSEAFRTRQWQLRKHIYLVVIAYVYMHKHIITACWVCLGCLHVYDFRD